MDMRRAGGLLSLLLSLSVGMPVNAQSPPSDPTSAFDGIYVGVSAENNSTGNTLAG
jgi:hypothetical protein